MDEDDDDTFVNVIISIQKRQAPMSLHARVMYTDISLATLPRAILLSRASFRRSLPSRGSRRSLPMAHLQIAMVCKTASTRPMPTQRLPLKA